MPDDNNPLISVRADRIRPGPIRHADLPPELLAKIEAVYRDAGHFTCGTLEEFERDFMRDMRPDRETAVWRQIADALLLYSERHLKGRPLSDEEGARLVSTLAGISMGMHCASQLLRLNAVDKYVARRLLACWQSLHGSTFAPVTLAVPLE